MTETSARNPRWLWSATAVDGLGTGVVYAVLAVLVAERFGLIATGVALGLGSAGRLVAVALVRWVELSARSPNAIRRWYIALVAALVAVSTGVLAAAWQGPYWLVVVLEVVFVVCNSATTTILFAEGRDNVVRLGPATMAGQATGALIAGAALALGGVGAITAITAVMVIQALQVPLLDRFGYASVVHQPVAYRQLAKPLYRGLMLAMCCYGPLAIYAALVKDVAGVAWIGPAMVAYAAGALCAPWLSNRLPVWQRWPAVLLLGAFGVGAWVVAVNGPLLLLARFASGMLLFAVQGRFMSRVTDDVPGPSGISVASMGLGVGAGVGSIPAGVLAARFGVSGMGAVLASGTVLVAAALLAAQRWRKTG